MIKLLKKIISGTAKFLIIFIFLIYVPEIIHITYYWIIPKVSCSYYTNKSPEFIANKFYNTSGATQEMAYYFFNNCKNNNSFLLDYYAPEFLPKKGLNPFFIIPMPYKVYKFDIHILAKSLSDKIGVKYIEVNDKHTYETYFKEKIENKITSSLIKPSEYKTFEHTYLFFIFFCITFLIYLKVTKIFFKPTKV